ncbi:hypothetical protein SteCoe_16639 [Stentor coeruleus]|uniref:FYVE-type domain-containing protein n=1 Tax=Stentor coeruleus TaxID=5963 RepID=A0A1R2C0P4_9CILI|nr:hypothetical protein SteCoe_16639 [Stentor coeruleus]
MDSQNSYNFSDSDHYDEDDDSIEETFILPSRRNLWESDSRCQSCLINFNILGVAHTKKTMCNFCYRGVCVKCLCYSRKHPESHISSKMCRACHLECKSIRHISGKIQQALLEKQQMELEVSVAYKEKEDVTHQRQAVELQIKKFEALKHLSLEEKANELKQVNHMIEEHKNIKETIIAANLILDEQKGKLFMYIKELQKFISDLKAGIKQNEDAETRYRMRISKKKEKILAIYQAHKNRTCDSLIASEKIKEKTIEIDELVKKLEDTGRINKDLENKLETFKEKGFKNDTIIHELHTKASEAKTSFIESDAFTEEQENELSKKRSLLVEYEMIIKKYHDRLDLLRKEASRQRKASAASVQSHNYEQSSLLIQYEAAKRTNTNTVQGNLSCKQCIVI